MKQRLLLFTLALLLGLSNTVLAQQSLRDFLKTKQASPIEATEEPATADSSFTVQADKERYQNGDTFSLTVKSSQDGYLYIHNMVPNAGPVQMFPLNGETNQIEANTEVQYPKPESSYKWQINQESGKERVLVTFSPKALTETELKESLLNKRVEIISSNPPQIKQVLLELPIGVNSDSAPAAKKRVAVIISQMFIFKGDGIELDSMISFRTGNFIHVYSALKKSKDFEKIYFLSFANLNKKNLGYLFQKIKEETSPGDEIFMYWESYGFSGHNRFPDTSNTETSGSHEFLCLGYLTPEGKIDLDEVVTDDEFADLLLTLKDRRMMVLLTASHSGGVLQGSGTKDSFHDGTVGEFFNEIMEKAQQEYEYESLFKQLPSILEGTSFAKKLPGNNTTKSGGISLREFMKSNSQANNIEAESLFVKAVENRVDNLTKDIGPDHPNLAIITDSAFNEYVWCPVCDKDARCLAYNFTKNEWFMQNMKERFEDSCRFVSPPVFSLLVAMMDTSGIFNEDPKCTDFEDVWKIMKELIPLNNERCNSLVEEEKRRESQTPQYFNSAGKILLRTQK